jgi:hypothetical protein
MNYSDFLQLIKARQADLKSKSLPSSITQAQFKLLEYLWNAGTQFPRNWVPRSELHNLINQSDYRRRITELKDERGIDVELDKKTNQYRLVSPNLKDAFPRAYLSPKQKKGVLERDNFKCQGCGIVDINNETGALQADHKIPLSRTGSHDLSNWQTLCHVCNVVKRRACEGCQRDCRSCVWAFPEKHGAKLLLNFSTEFLAKLEARKLKDNSEITTFLESILQ